MFEKSYKKIDANSMRCLKLHFWCITEHFVVLETRNEKKKPLWIRPQ